MATMMMRTNRPAIAGTKYWSATDCAGVAVGAGVAAASPIAKAVPADDGPYACDPAKVAVIW